MVVVALKNILKVEKFKQHDHHIYIVHSSIVTVDILISKKKEKKKTNLNVSAPNRSKNGKAKNKGNL